MTYFDKKEGPTNKVGKIYVVSDDNIEMAKKIVYKSVYSITSQSRSGIQSTQSEFKLIRFNDSRRDQVGKPVRDKNAIADVVDILGDVNNCLLFKNNVEYEWVRFIQASKMTKRPMTIFFSNLTLIHM